MEVPDYDPGQESVAFHPDLINTKALLVVEEVDRLAADPSYKKQFLEQAKEAAAAEREVLLELRAGALENDPHTSQGEWLARLDEDKLFKLLEPTNEDYDPEKLRQATTSLAEAHKQNKIRETEQRALNAVFTPMVGSFSYWPDHLLDALSDGTLNPTSTSGTLDGTKLNEVLRLYLDFKASVQIPGKVKLGKLFSDIPDFTNLNRMRVVAAAGTHGPDTQALAHFDALSTEGSDEAVVWRLVPLPRQFQRDV